MYQPIRLGLLAASLLASMGAWAQTAQELKTQGLVQLTGAEIESLSSGQTLDHKMIGTRMVAPIFYRSDKTRVVNATAFGGRIYETKWWIEGNKRCEISGRTKQTQCGQVFKRNAEYVMCFDDEEQCGWTFTLRPGNPDHLGE